MLTAVNKIVYRFFQSNGSHKRYIESKIAFNWDKIAGDKLKNKAWVSYFSHGTLFLSVCHSSWANELQFFKKELLQKINDCLQKPLVKDIKFKVNGYKNQILPSKPQKTKQTFINITQEEINQIGEISDSCNDQEIRHWIKEIMLKEKSYEKQKEKDGWRKCRFCSTLQNNLNNICPVCKQNMDQYLINKIQNYLGETPWLSLEDMIKIIPEVKEAHYVQAKKQKIIKLRYEIEENIKKIEKDYEEKLFYQLKNIILKYTLLITGLRPVQITPEIMREVIGEYYCKILNY